MARTKQTARPSPRVADTGITKPAGKSPAVLEMIKENAQRLKHILCTGETLVGPRGGKFVYSRNGLKRYLRKPKVSLGDNVVH